MTLLQQFPHTAKAEIRVRTRGALGGSVDSFSTVFSGVACWQQHARESEITEFEKRGLAATDKVYFLTDPGLDERHILTITNPRTGSERVFEVRSRAEPDASAGLGVVYRVMCELRTTEGAQ